MTHGAGPRPRARRTVAPLVAGLRFYQAAVSPLLGPRCRFEPSCSAYAVEALQVHGVVRGLALALWRLLRCQPLSRGGYDPVRPSRRGAGRRGDGAGDDGRDDRSERPHDERPHDSHPHDGNAHDSHSHDIHPHDGNAHDSHPHDNGASVPAGLPPRGARPC